MVIQAPKPPQQAHTELGGNVLFCRGALCQSGSENLLCLGKGEFLFAGGIAPNILSVKVKSRKIKLDLS